MSQLDIKIPFYENEVKCPCGCGQAIIQPEHLHKMCALRWRTSQPIIVNSWNRCKNYNKKVGGTEDSEHIYGLATDVKVESSLERHNILKAAIMVKFNRIGIYSWGLHLGSSINKPIGVIWLG